MVAPAIVLGLRGVQVLLSIIVLGLTAYLVDAFTNPWGSWSPHSLNFMLFTSLWTLLAVAYLVLSPTRFPRAAHKYAIGAVEFLTMLFWFAAFIAVAVLWGDIWWAGSKGTFYGCGVAAIVFSAFLWLTFVATTVLAALHIRNTPRNDTAPPPDMAGV
ncbi:Nn.00g117480.m01.CDS01 [Neocucurbitaria sp. VM-36]